MTVSFALKHLFHSTNWVPDLEASAEFFRRVFGRQSTILGEYLGGSAGPAASGHARDYAIFTPIAEVQFECANPALMVADGVQLQKTVSRPRLGGLAWFVDGIEDLWSELRRRHIRGMDQRNRIFEGDDSPIDGSTAPMIFTWPEDTGLSYEFCVYSSRLDPRGDPPVAAVSLSDPLGIECCSHHTVLTDRPQRAQRLLVDVLGGRISHQGANELLHTESTYIALADGVVELARPVDEASPAMQTWRRRAPRDTYYSLAWKVRDLDSVANHLRTSGVRLQAHTDTALLTDPADGLGVAWAFASMLSPGDARAGR